MNDAFRKYQLLDIIFIVSKKSPNVAERYLESASKILFSSLSESYHVWKSNYRQLYTFFCQLKELDVHLFPNWVLLSMNPWDFSGELLLKVIPILTLY